MDYKYRETKYYCGDFLDVDIYPVFKKTKSRSKRFKPTSEIQKKLNENNARKKLERLIHTNFTPNDIALHLTYTAECLPANEEQSKKDIQNYIRRLKRVYQKSGKELKYISVTEKGEKTDRVHHHIIINGGIDRDIIENIWQKGYANTKRLQFTKNGIAGLSNYITKQPLYFRRWNRSKNLKQPIIRKNDSKYNRTKARGLFEFQYDNKKIEKLYRGYLVSEIVPCFNEVNAGYYIQIKLYKKEARLL